MLDFERIADGLYLFYDHGNRSDPLTRSELDAAILAAPLSDVDMAVIDCFYQEVRG